MSWTAAGSYYKAGDIIEITISAQIRRGGGFPVVITAAAAILLAAGAVVIVLIAK